ncbi:MAG: helix-turn-helix transcriptional regulator [Pseudomonadota bacterium]
MEHQHPDKFQSVAALGFLPDFEALVGALPMALAFLDLGGRYVYQNARFGGLVCDHDGLVRAPHMVFCLRNANRDLSAFLKRCRSAPGQAGETRLFLDSDQCAPLSVAFKYDPSTRLILALPARVRPIRPGAHTQAVLNRTYGLTPAEAECACLLAEGLSREAIAARRAVSFETIRCQLRSVRRKLNVRSANEIIARVLSFGDAGIPV